MKSITLWQITWLQKRTVLQRLQCTSCNYDLGPSPPPPHEKMHAEFTMKAADFDTKNTPDLGLPDFLDSWPTSTQNFRINERLSK